MVEKFKKILEKVEREKGKVILFAVMKMDDLTDKWSMFISATWATNESSAADFAYLRNIVIDTMSLEEQATIARIAVVQKDHYITQLFLRFNKDQVIKNEKVNGFIIHEAYILESNPMKS